MQYLQQQIKAELHGLNAPNIKEIEIMLIQKYGLREPDLSTDVTESTEWKQ